jgi:hypothetical protein
MPLEELTRYTKSIEALRNKLLARGINPRRAIRHSISTIAEISNTFEEFQVYLTRLENLAIQMEVQGSHWNLFKGIAVAALSADNIRLIYHPEIPRKVVSYWEERTHGLSSYLVQEVIQEHKPAWIEVVPVESPAESGVGGVQASAAELAEIRGRLVERLGPQIEQGGYALVLHPEPSSQDAANIINRSMDLGFDFDHIIVVDTPEKAKAYIANPEYNIVYFVNRLPGVDLQGPLAGLGIADVSGGVASVVPETAKDLEIWL